MSETKCGNVTVNVNCGGCCPCTRDMFPPDRPGILIVEKEPEMNFLATFTAVDPSQTVRSTTLTITDGTGVVTTMPWDGGTDDTGNRIQQFACDTPVGPDGTVGTVAVYDSNNSTVDNGNGPGNGPVSVPVVLPISPPPVDPPITMAPTILSVVPVTSGKGGGRSVKRVINGKVCFVKA